MMTIMVLDDYTKLSFAAAEVVARYVNENPGRLICFAAGGTPMGMFRVLAKLQAEKKMDLSTMWHMGLDEWVGLGYEDTGSCRQSLLDGLFLPAGIPAERVMMFDGRDGDLDGQCRRVDAWIVDKGGIGLAVLGIGMNGHLGFNEPGTAPDKGCITVDLDGTTTSVGRKYFSGADTPVKGITVGLGSLLDADTIILLAAGEEKAAIVKAALEGPADVRNPASMLQLHGNCLCVLDRAAASKLANPV